VIQVAKMGFRYLAALILACLVATGCRRDAYVDAYLEMLNAEKRALEDRLYELEYDYEQALEELEKLRAHNSGEGDERQTDVGEPIDELDFLPEIKLPPGLDGGSGESAVPPASESAATGTQPASGVLRTAGRDIGQRAASEPSSTELDERIDHVYINPRLTGGEDFDQRPGDDGLAVLIEPRNKAGQFVPKPAAVTIVLLDPTKNGDAARYALWEFDQDVAEEVLRTDPLDRGLLFRVPWSGAPPDSDRLHLFVRYHTADGRKLEADRLITIRPPGRVAQGWTPRVSDSQGPDATR
jgi:hypothetical protein